MQIKKAVITAAGNSQRTLPLQTVVDSDGETKTALRIIIEEVLATGVEEICVIISPGDEAAFRRAAGQPTGRLTFVEQSSALGYGHAVFCAKNFLSGEAFLLLVGDHLYVSTGSKRPARHLVEIALHENCAASAVQATHESKLPYYGVVGGRLVAGRKGIYEISDVIEKPTPTQAEQHLIVPGLRTGHYLCFFGMHVLTPLLIDLLEEEIRNANGRNVQLSPSLNKLARRERYVACELSARRYDIGVKYGLLMAQLAVALAGSDREELLAQLVDLLARREIH